jgi:hypothetical protein
MGEIEARAWKTEMNKKILADLFVNVMLIGLSGSFKSNVMLTLCGM